MIMRATARRLSVALIALLHFIGMGSVAKASLITFEVDWAAGTTIPDANSKVIATGLVTIDTTLLPNPGNYRGDILPIITDLTINVTGAVVGNGSFDLSYYQLFYWSTGRSDGPPGLLTLDLTKELVGQPYPDGVGFLQNKVGYYGEFNFIAKCSLTTCDEPIAPTGVDTFTMRTLGGHGDYMTVSSVRPVSVTEIPEPAMLPIAGLALIVVMKFGRLTHSGFL
jgi:hypothetical protein